MLSGDNSSPKVFIIDSEYLGRFDFHQWNLCHLYNSREWIKMIPHIVSLKLPKIIDTAQRLSSKGNTQLTENNLFCLNIDDNYIHQLFPLLEDPQVKKPNYFGEKSIGAHITIVYPEESKSIDAHDLQQEHSFFVKNIASAEIGQKTYYVLLVDSPSLLQLRRKYNLPDLLSFKGYSIEFHITIGVS